MKLYTMFGSRGDEYSIHKTKGFYSIKVNGICTYSTNNFKYFINRIRGYNIVSIEILAIHVKTAMGLEYKHCFITMQKQCHISEIILRIKSGLRKMYSIMKVKKEVHLK